MKAKLNIFFALIVSIFAFQCALNTDNEEGKKMYLTYCAVCHGDDGNTVNVGMHKKLRLSETTLSERIEIIQHGHNNFATFDLILTEEDTRKIAKFSFTL